MTKSLSALVGLVLLLPATADAHELKVFAGQLVAAVGETSTVFLSWGHRVPVDELVDASSLERYEHRDPSGKPAKLEASGRSFQPNVVTLEAPGVHRLLVERTAGVYTIGHDADGNRLFLRGPKNDVGQDVRIDYGMRSRQTAEALIVVGEPSAEPIEPTGLPVEIVPLDGPAAWTRGRSLRFRVLVDAKPLGHASLVARDVGFVPANAWCYATTTDEEGVATVVPNRAGTWILKVNSKELVGEKLRELYDYESLTTTLVLEVRP